MKNPIEQAASRAQERARVAAVGGKPQHCGHASRYRNERGCVKCRRENGATMPKHDFKPRRETQQRAQDNTWDALTKAATELGLS